MNCTSEGNKKEVKNKCSDDVRGDDGKGEIRCDEGTKCRKKISWAALSEGEMDWREVDFIPGGLKGTIDDVDVFI